MRKLLVIFVLILVMDTMAGYRGKIIDAETKQPVVGAWVVGTWSRGFIHGMSCYSLDAAVTDKNGMYELRRPLSSYLFGVGPSLQAHKNGYQMKVHIENAGYKIDPSRLESPIGHLYKTKLNDDIRLKYLQHSANRAYCYGVGKDNKKLYTLIKSMLDEAIPLARTANQLKIVKYLCEQAAGVAVSEDKAQSAGEYYDKSEQFIKTNLPECQNIHIDPLENKRLLLDFLSGDRKRVEKALEKGFNIDARFEKQRTALAIASQNGNLDAIRVLVDMGADPNTKDEKYALILQQVIKEKNLSMQKKLEVVELLINIGADINKPDAWNKTPFSLAVTLGEIALVELMIEAGANVNDNDIDPERDPLIYSRSPPLHNLALRKVDVAKILIKAGADVNLVGEHGHTPLMWWASSGDPEMVKLLIDNGADVHAVSKSGSSAFVFAMGKYNRESSNKKEKFKEIINILRDAGAGVPQQSPPGDNVN